jgi:hypothetical protein
VRPAGLDARFSKRLYPSNSLHFLYPVRMQFKMRNGSEMVNFALSSLRHLPRNRSLCDRVSFVDGIA